jgi:hypothetical protein
VFSFFFLLIVSSFFLLLFVFILPFSILRGAPAAGGCLQKERERVEEENVVEEHQGELFFTSFLSFFHTF